MPSTQLFQEDFSDIIDVSEVLEAGVYDDPTTGIQMDNTPEAMEHGLFMERLQSFMQSQTDAVMAFALREGKPYEVVRRHVALAHSKILFDQPLVEEGATGATDHGTVNLSLVPTVRSVVVRICSALDILYNLCQFESLLLVTSGNDQDKSFVGGSKLGKAFWDSMKAGGKNGVKAFKKHAKQRGVAEDAGTSTGRKVKNSLKIELNTAMRVALRNASGNTSAEMRWARPEQLEGWGVRLAGWPQDIPFRNPSDNTVAANARILELLQTGKIRFIKREDPDWETSIITPSSSGVALNLDMRDAEGDRPSTSQKTRKSRTPRIPAHQQQPSQLMAQMSIPGAIPNSYVLVPQTFDASQLLRPTMYPAVSPNLLQSEALRRNLTSTMLAVPINLSWQQAPNPLGDLPNPAHISGPGMIPSTEEPATLLDVLERAQSTSADVSILDNAEESSRKRKRDDQDERQPVSPPRRPRTPVFGTSIERNSLDGR